MEPQIQQKSYFVLPVTNPLVCTDRNRTSFNILVHNRNAVNNNIIPKSYRLLVSAFQSSRGQTCSLSSVIENLTLCLGLRSDFLAYVVKSYVKNTNLCKIIG
jgi:hypothetical protein